MMCDALYSGPNGGQILCHLCPFQDTEVLALAYLDRRHKREVQG